MQDSEVNPAFFIGQKMQDLKMDPAFLFVGALAGATLANAPNFHDEHPPAKNNLKNLQKRY